MVRAHRQAWAWQDEWVGLSIDDIRGLEAETQQALAHKMEAHDEGTTPTIHDLVRNYRVPQVCALTSTLQLTSHIRRKILFTDSM